MKTIELSKQDKKILRVVLDVFSNVVYGLGDAEDDLRELSRDIGMEVDDIEAWVNDLDRELDVK